MEEKNNGINIDYDYNKLRESVRHRPGMFFGSTDLCGLQNAIMDLVYHCIENQKHDIDIVINRPDITVGHEGETLAPNFYTDVVRSACETFDYQNNQYQFRFDNKIFENIEPNHDVLFDALRELAFLNKLLKIRLNGHCFCYENGLMDFYQYLKIKAGLYWHERHQPIGFYTKEGDMEMDAVFAAAHLFDPCIFSFVNNCRTQDNGAHVNGFLKGLREEADKYKQNSSERMKIIRNDGIGLIIHIKTPTPQYSGATKREIINREVYQFVKRATKENAGRIFAENPDMALTYIKW